MKDYNEIISTCLRRAGSAVSGIMGERLLFIGQTGRFVELRDGVGQQLSEQILVRLEVSGAGGPPGDAWLAVNTADAIRLAGRLVMLPESELEEAVAANELEDEIHYAFLEMVNVISISFSKTLTELAGKPYLLKVVGEQEYPDYTMGDEHITAQDYYRVEASMVLGSQKLGKFVLLILPRTMELEARLGTKQRVEKAVKKAAENNAVASGTNSETPNSALKALLSEFRLLIAQEFSVLLGMEVGCFGENGLSIDLPQPLLDPVLPAKAAAHLIISGECTAEAYLVADIEDAIRLAGHFLALPAVELEAAIVSGIFDSDLQDGFSEIANLVAGLCSLLFDKRYQASVIFDKKEILQTELEENHPAENEQQAEPTVDLTLAEPAADKGQTSANRVYPVEIHLYAQNELIGGFDFLFPKQLADFILSQPALATEPAYEPPAEKAAQRPAADFTATSPAREKSGPLQILLISDSDQDSIGIKEVFDRLQIGWTEIGFRDDVTKLLPGAYSAIFLVSRQPDEQTFGVAIKVSSRCSLPLIVASSRWTQSSVFQAVRYGVSDILLTPASSADVQEKIKTISNSQAA